MKALGIHVFAGSFSIGVQEHADVEAHLEYDGYASETAQSNFDFPVIENKEDWPEDPKQEFGDVDFLFGNPPCAPFSVQAGGSSGGVEDDRIGRIREVVSTADQIRPRVWAFESVTQAYTKGKDLIDDIEAKAKSMGYNVTHYLHDVNFHGVPQSRKRYLFIAHDMPIDWDLPEPERVGIDDKANEIFDENPDKIIEPLNDDAREAWNEMIPELEPGQRLRELWMSKDDPDGWKPFQTVRKMRTEGPACAALGGVRFIHPFEDRFLSVRELARFMGYPDDYEFDGSSTTQDSYYIAKGVAAPVGEWLARNVKENLEREPEQTEMTIVIDAREEQFGYRFFEA